MFLYQSFRVTGVANSIQYDDGLKSTEAEPKRLVSILCQADAYPGSDDVDIQGYHERAKVIDIPIQLFSQVDATDTTDAAGGKRMIEIPVDLDIPVGETFKMAIKCAANAVNIRGAYKYEIIS